jgi:glucose/arabinose dehydrogenase
MSEQRSADAADGASDDPFGRPFEVKQVATRDEPWENSLLIYDGSRFPEWRGNALIDGLSSQALVRVEIDGDQPAETERFAMGRRIREVEQGPDGAIWLLEDGTDGRLLKLVPAG